MKHEFCNIRINVTKYDVTFTIKRGVLTHLHSATSLHAYTGFAVLAL